MVDIAVPFHDIDVMGIVWHGNYVKYFEIARCAVLQAIDYDYPQMKESGYAWPIVDMRSRYVQPAHYNDPLQVIAIIVEWEIRLLIKYLIVNKASQRVITRGQSTQVPLVMKSMAMEYGSPALLGQKVEAWKEKHSRGQ